MVGDMANKPKLTAFQIAYIMKAKGVCRRLSPKSLAKKFNVNVRIIHMAGNGMGMSIEQWETKRLRTRNRVVIKADNTRYWVPRKRLK
jgi:hypothetical protein